MKKRAVCAIGVFLCAAVMGNSALAASAAAADACDYSRRGSAYASVGVADLLAEAYGETLCEAERGYLNAHSSVELKYSDKIGTDYITAELSGERLDITARPYSYVALNGKSVLWTPVAVNGEPLSQTNGGYAWVNSAVGEEEEAVTVTYEASFSVSKSLLNSAANAAYGAAVEAQTTVERKALEYAELHAAWAEDVKNYNDYIQAAARYEADSARYEEYVRQYGEWKPKYDAYQAYLEEYRVYTEELDAYNNYQPAYEQYLKDLASYNEYLVALRQYEEKYAEFLANVDIEKLNKVRSDLAILEFISTPVAMDRTLRGAITGSTVTMVLEQKDALVEYIGADESAIDLAGVATENLRRLIAAYDNCKTEEEKYIFYISCYDDLVKNFSDLLRTLDFLYRNNIVRRMIKSQNKEPQYQILLAQLFVISNALDDNPIGNYDKVYKFDKTNACDYDSAWRIDGKTPLSVLENVEYLQDTNNAAPLEEGYPALSEEPVKPAEVQKPLPPQPAKKPVEPAEVADPGPAPEEVVRPTAPVEVSAPGDEPQPYAPTEEEAALIEALNGGYLAAREELTADYVAVKRTEVVKKFRNVTEVTVHFYADKEATSPLLVVTAELGSFVEFTGELPTRYKLGYTCEFDYWTDEEGNRVNTDSISVDKGDINLYPHFSETPNDYPVTWVIDGVEQTEYFPYGQLPRYEGTPQKTGDGPRLYRFTGWDKEIAAVTEKGARYVATFESGCLISWSVNGSVKTLSVWAGEMPEYGEEVFGFADSLYYYSFAGWDGEISAATEDAVYTAIYIKNHLVAFGEEGALVTEREGVYLADCSRFADRTADIYYLLRLAAEEGKGVEIKRSDCVLSFDAPAAAVLAGAGVAGISVSLSQTAAESYKYSVDFADGNGERLAPQSSFSFSAYGVFNALYSHMYRTDAEGNVSEVRYSAGEGSVAFAMTCGGTYEIYPQYAVNIIASPYVAISVPSSAVKAGERVYISLGDLAAGMALGGLYAVDAEGNDVEIVGGTFRMPHCDVSVGAVCVFEEYTVVFKSDGRTLSTKKYRYGEEITPPPDPTKGSDGQYVYTFAGWSQEPGVVTGDAEFTAVYTAEPVPAKENTGPSTLKKLITAAIIAVVAFVVLAAALVAFIIIRARKRKKRGKA